MANANFDHLLKKTAGTSKRPPVLPIGNYPGKIKNWLVDDKNQNKTPYLKVICSPTEWPENIEDSDKMQEGPNGNPIPINLMSRTLNRDIYLRGKDGSDQMYRVDDLLRELGIELGGRSYEECFPEMIGKDVLIEVGIYVNPQSGEPGNQVNKLKGLSS